MSQNSSHARNYHAHRSNTHAGETMNEDEFGRAANETGRGYAHFAHNAGLGGNINNDSRYENSSTMEGLARGPGSVFGNSAGGFRRHALMPTKGRVLCSLQLFFFCFR